MECVTWYTLKCEIEIIVRIETLAGTKLSMWSCDVTSVGCIALLLQGCECRMRVYTVLSIATHIIKGPAILSTGDADNWAWWTSVWPFYSFTYSHVCSIQDWNWHRNMILNIMAEYVTICYLFIYSRHNLTRWLSEYWAHVYFGFFNSMIWKLIVACLWE